MDYKIPLFVIANGVERSGVRNLLNNVSDDNDIKEIPRLLARNDIKIYIS